MEVVFVYALLGTLHLGLFGLDVASFFVAVRVLRRVGEFGPVVAFDRAGSDVVSLVMSVHERVLFRWCSRQLREIVKLCTCFASLASLKWMGQGFLGEIQARLS